MSRVVFLIALIAATAAAQTVANPPPICFAFNDNVAAGSWGSVWIDPAGGVLTTSALGGPTVGPRSRTSCR